MPRYEPVRSVSPPGEHREDGPAPLGQGKQEDADTEQKERLLSNDDDGDVGSDVGSDVDDGGEESAPTSAHPRWWLIASLTGAAISLMVVLAVLVRLFINLRGSEGANPSANPTTDTVASFRRPTEDYVLDPTWDFDAPPTIREYSWVIGDVVANPDGVFRPMMVINGRFPGELIRCNEGDTIVVNVENRSVNSTAIHWHGIFQNGTSWMDGTPGVSQCPIAPGRKFRYEFTVKGQAGTYFYHGHQAAQHLDGLVGPIVIHARDERILQQLPYASDRIIMLQDWYHDLSGGLLWETLSPGSETSPVPNGALINGANVVDCSLHPGRRCDNSSAYLPSLELTPMEGHRLRVLNVGGFAWFEVTIDGHHNLAVTEIDGTAIQPSPETGVLVGPGQRYSVVLSANQTSKDAYWLRARMLNHCFAENVLPEQGVAEARAILRYGLGEATEPGAQQVLPTSENDSGRYATVCKDMRTRTYSPVPVRPAPEFAHHSWYLRVNLEIGNWRLERGFLNTSTFRPNLKSPTLHRVLDGLATNNQSFQRGGVNTEAFHAQHELVISNRHIEVVDVILQNFDEGNHPFHLHGTQMWVLASGHGYFPGYEPLGLKPEGKGLLHPNNSTIIDNPLRRDVATVEGFGWLLIRFIADNPGIWLFHCHMIWHAEAGMGMQFLSRLDVMQNWTIPEENARLCNASIEDLEKGATPKDSIWDGNAR